MTEETSASAPFEAFNAKYLGPEEVAKGFVYSQHFEELSGPYHAALVGPRGSGKTTLLKMLQPAALAAWSSTFSSRFRDGIKYSGVFVASDISWSKQLSSLGYGKLSADNHRTLVLACFTTHVLHAVLETMISRTDHRIRYRYAQLKSPAEEALITEIAPILQVRPDIGSLLSVKHSLRNRLTDIRVLANRGSLLPQSEFAGILANNNWLHLDVLDVVSNITEHFNESVDQCGERWALLFDELETAPDWIIEQLFSAFRVSDPKIYLKLAISPVSQTAYRTVMSSTGPALGHDHRIIPLWYSDRVESRSFCHNLWTSIAEQAGVSISIEEALGTTLLDPDAKINQRKASPYDPGGSWHSLFVSLAKKDRTFAAFLRGKGVDLGSEIPSEVHKRNTVLRKAAPIAAVKEFYLHESRIGEVSPRFRKTSVLYAGAASIVSITDGNPRWFIGLVSPFIAYLAKNKTRRVPDVFQAKEIENAADRLIALIRTIPITGAVAGFDAEGLDQILERIGQKLHNDLLSRNFTLDPRLHFLVDEKVPPHILELLSSGLNRGAVMLVEDTASSAIVKDVADTRLRLSYLLAAKYGLPLRKGKQVTLSNLIPFATVRNTDARQLSLAMDAIQDDNRKA